MRAVFITDADILAIENAGYSLYRAKEDSQALTLHALALRFRSELGIGLHDEFRCDVDESAGMAEVVELKGYSKRVPCS